MQGPSQGKQGILRSAEVDLLIRSEGGDVLYSGGASRLGQAPSVDGIATSTQKITLAGRQSGLSESMRVIVDLSLRSGPASFTFDAIIVRAEGDAIWFVIASDIRESGSPYTRH